jgi:thiol-disulfide isomerase/thioredoxin
MKKLVYLSFSFLFCFSCSKPEYVIVGEAVNTGPDGSAIRLFSVDTTGNSVLLSTDTIRNHQFSFTGSGNSGLGYIEFEEGEELWKRYLLLEPGTLHVVMDNEFAVTGTPANNDYQVALGAEILLEEVESEYYREKENGASNDELKEIEKRCNEQFENVKEKYVAFFRNNINNPLGREIFASTRWMRRLNLEQLESILNLAGASFQTTGLYKASSERLHNMKTSLPGNDYKDILSRDPAGNPVALSGYAGKGKYVLLVFWASWCPPCREEAPNLVKLYREYKGKNFEIVSYSLDNNEDAWKRGIELLHLTWPQMSDCKHWDAPAVKSYAVQSIPCTILIDPAGKIIHRGLLGDELASVLKNLIK